MLIFGLAVFLYQRRSFDHWYGAFQIGDSTVIHFISVGTDVFYDANSDGVPQRDELVAPNGEVRIISGAGGEEFTLENVSILFIPEAVSSGAPQMTDVTIQSKKHPSVWRMGTVTMSLNRDNAETCHLMRPLSFLPLPQGFELTAGELNLIKISIGTDSAQTTGVLVRTSPIGDRTSYAFDDSERPKLKIWFGDEAEPPEEFVFDGFC